MMGLESTRLLNHRLIIERLLLETAASGLEQTVVQVQERNIDPNRSQVLAGNRKNKQRFLHHR